jgi:riboflavin kinase / FMN adenylyltransferase
MQVIRSISAIATKIMQGSVVTIGNYDGVHLGHQAILKQIKTFAHQLSLPSVVIIFEPLPEEFFVEDTAHVRLMRLQEKLHYLKQLQIDFVLCLHFDAAMAALSATEFVQRILLDALKVRCLIVGDDFALGHRREGDAVFLANCAQHHNFKFVKIDPYKIDGVRVSSTLIRTALLHDNLAEAQKLLGNPYAVMGRVVHGAKIGHTLGYPTANIYSSHKLLPFAGVYLVRVQRANGQLLNGVANVGVRPTINDSKKLLEVYLLNFAENIYGEKLNVHFLRKIREEKKFPSLEALRQQIAEDVKMAQRFFA